MSLSSLNPFQSAKEDTMELEAPPEKSYREFVEEKFLKLIKEGEFSILKNLLHLTYNFVAAHSLGSIHIGRTNVMEALESGIRGLVFFAGESPYSRNIPVCQLCIDKMILYHVFASGKELNAIVNKNSSVVMVENHCSYYGLFDLCKTAVEILNDH